MPSEFSKVINVEAVLRKKDPIILQASKDELLQLTKRMRVISISNLEVEFDLIETEQKNIINLHGVLNAKAQQPCTITGTPVDEVISDTFFVKLYKGKRPDEDAVDFTSENLIEDIDYIEDGEIDLGEIASQYLALNLNPYPRSDQADVVEKEYTQSHDSVNPFQTLKKLIKNEDEV